MGAARRRAIHPVLVAVVLVWAVGFGAAAGRTASDHRRRILPWVVYGAILGPLALLILRLAPPGRCWACDAPSTGWTRICLWCGTDLAADPRRARPAATATASVATAPPVRAAKRRPARPEPAAPSGAAPDLSPAALATPLTAAPTPERPPVRRAGQARRVAPTPAEVKTPVRRPRRESPAVALQPPTELRRTLATGVFVTGTVGLRSGSRYLIALAGQRLQVLGPAEDDPTAVVFERPVGETDATGFNERLVISQSAEAGSSKVLVFMALAGGTPESVADDILGAAASSQRNAS